MQRLLRITLEHSANYGFKLNEDKWKLLVISPGPMGTLHFPNGSTFTRVSELIYLGALFPDTSYLGVILRGHSDCNMDAEEVTTS
eukprot:4721424-Amphidinium_carterae.1